jgi:ABC-type antimicrobial peptide transport system permease subunit
VLNGPQNLTALMKANGVPTSEEEIKNSRLQTNWLIGLALLVAFVGILNAMLMSVTERFREIGTMKCLGALDSFIVKLFIIESFFQGGAGTLAGVVLGLLLNVIGVSTAYGAFAWKRFPYGSIGVAALVCLVVGIVLTVAGAVYPAWRAARMHPIEAMRVEA